MEKALESLKQLPQGYKKQQFDFFFDKQVILGNKRYKLHVDYLFPQKLLLNFFVDGSKCYYLEETILGHFYKRMLLEPRYKSSYCVDRFN